MPRIFDNIEQHLITALQETLEVANNADFCVGYLNLRGWKHLAPYIDSWEGGENRCCRLLVGMQKPPHEELRTFLSLSGDEEIDQQAALRLKKKLAEEFRDQLTIGIPNNDDEKALRKLAAQIKAKKVVVRLFLKHSLHAKLYLLFRPDPINPIVGYLGSSNLTLSGLSKQGELNIDVLDGDACQKLSKWFEDRWNNRWCIDISDDLKKVIEESWAREENIPPYHIYLKMAYNLSQEARAGLSEFKIPKDFGHKLFEYQEAAVKIAAHHLNKRGGVLIGDVVGLGKTLMATALARIFEDDHDLETLIICPKNLVKMWENYRETYRMRARVLSLSRVMTELPDLRRYRLVIIDESQNLRNREGKRYHAIYEYIRENESKCILLSATPYNKTYLDLSNQLRLFVPEHQDMGLRPERKIQETGETEFIRQHQCPVRSLAAFEKSEYADDWRDLMRLYLVRRTRTFIQDNYAKTDPLNGRKFIVLEDGSRSYFPERTPRSVKFTINENDSSDQYAKLFSVEVVNTINDLNLPRYGLGNYEVPTPHAPPTPREARHLQDLSRAGKRLMGFCRTNMFKRLESSGHAFIQSINRHILRNYIFLYAIEKGLPLPLGTQGAEMLDARLYDGDADDVNTANIFDDNDDDKKMDSQPYNVQTEEEYKNRAEEVYSIYSTRFKQRFKWLRSNLFIKALGEELENDAISLLRISNLSGEWNPSKDTKLEAIFSFITDKHPNEKVLIFTQFADTVKYLEDNLLARGIKHLKGVTGDSADPTAVAWSFSPKSNDRQDKIKPNDELRVLIATDVLSEGQNLQDCSIIVNYDLPWAIIRLVQRAGRVDRIGQKAENILCYSFLPADGLERILQLRSRVRRRLQENAEVVGTDEAFFEDDARDQTVLDIYNEQSGIYDGDADGEVDLASYAYQIWKNAIDKDKHLEKIIPELPQVVYSTRKYQGDDNKPEGVLVYMQTAEGNDALAWIDKKGNSITQSQLAILKAAECTPEVLPIPRYEKHHELVRSGVEHLIQEEKSVGGQLGRPRGARFRTYERLKRYAEEIKETLFEPKELLRAIDDIYRNPLRESAKDTLNRQLKSGISDEALAHLVMALRDEGRLSISHQDVEHKEPKIICSLGLFSNTK